MALLAFARIEARVPFALLPRGFAAGLINTATQLGTAMSIALLVPLAAAPDDAIAGLRLASALTAAIAAAGGAAVLVLLRR